MKGIAAFLVFLALVGAGIWAYNAAWENPAMSIGVAYGKAAAGEASFELMVTRAMLMEADAPPHDKDGNPQWHLWNDAHIVLADASNAPVKLEMTRRSEVVPTHQQGNTEHFLVGRLKVGTEYTCVYQPQMGQGRKYVYRFAMPGDGARFTRVDFAPRDK